MGIVRDEDDGGPVGFQLADLVEAFDLEPLVTDGENLVHEQDVGFEVGRDRKPQANRHTGAIGLDRRVDELGDPGECDDLVEALVDLAPRDPQDGRVDVDVLAAGQDRTESGPERDQGLHAPPDGHAPLVWSDQPVKDPEERGFPRAVWTDEAKCLALIEVERRLPHRPELVSPEGGPVVSSPDCFRSEVTQAVPDRALQAATELLADPASLDQTHAHELILSMMIGIDMRYSSHAPAVPTNRHADETRAPEGSGRSVH